MTERNWTTPEGLAELEKWIAPTPSGWAMDPVQAEIFERAGPQLIRALRDRDAEIVRLREEIRALDAANAEVCERLAGYEPHASGSGDFRILRVEE